jgi:hypothetical protein
MKDTWTLRKWINANPRRAFFVAGVFFVPAFWLAFCQLSFDNRCAQTMGYLDASYIRTTRGFSTEYSVGYSYEVSGVTYRGWDGSLSEKPISRISPVYYDPQNPRKSQLERGRWRFLAACGGFFLLLGIIGYGAANKKAREAAAKNALHDNFTRN